MTYIEFCRQVRKAGLSLKGFALLVRMNRNSITNYKKSKEVPTHLAIMATLMGEMAEHEIDFITPLRNIDVQPRKPRGLAKGQFVGKDQKQE